MTPPRPGDLGCYDPDYVRQHAPQLRRLIHGYFRARVLGMNNLPEGPFLGVGNHSGAAMIPDTLVWLAAYHGADRTTPMLTLAHDSIFTAYPRALTHWLARFGALRADHALALKALQSGLAVQVYPGGDHDACRTFAQRHKIIFAGRKGYVALAREARVPIVPIASVGAHEALIILSQGRRLARWLGADTHLRLSAFPISLSVPWGLWIGPLPGYIPLPTKIELRVLPPIDPNGDPDEVDTRVRTALQNAVDTMARARRFAWIG